MLKVLFVSHADVVWGAERVLLDVAPFLPERGMEPILAAPDGGGLADAWSRLGFVHLPLNLTRHQGLRRQEDPLRRAGIGALAREGSTLARSVGRLVPLVSTVDVVHSNSLNAHLEVATGGRVLGIPAVIHVHDIVRSGLGRKVLGVAARLSTATLAISEAVAASIPFAATRVTVVHNGVDLERFRPGAKDPEMRATLGARPQDLLVGVLGRIDRSKGIDRAIRAVSQVIDEIPATRMAVVGSALVDPDFEDEVRQLGRHLLGDRVRFVPQRSDPEAVVRAFDVLVSASVAEPFGLSVLEAQASGAVVVATASGGIPELVAHGRTGLLAAGTSAYALAAVLRRALSDEGLRTTLARRARHEVETRYGLAALADRLAELYRRLGGRHGGSDSVRPGELRPHVRHILR